tara:strand:- start:2618 stop:3349 length:732 start_codon:yes stop_codon:yes gene_type:complete
MPHKVLRVKDPHDSYHIKKELFDLPMSLIVVGKSQLSGKSNFLTWLLCSDGAEYSKDFEGENMFIVSPSFSNDNKLKIIQRQFDIPETNIIHQFDEQLIEGIYEQVEEQYEEFESEDMKPPQSIIIFDDVSFDPDFKKSKIVKKIFQNGRHILLSTVVTAQVYTNVSTAARENSKGLILFDCSDRQIERMAFDHSQMPQREFKKMFRDTTKKKHSFLAINYSNDNDKRFLNTEFEPIDVEKYK